MDALQRALDELVQQRDQLDEDIRDLRRIISRRAPASEAPAPGLQAASANGRKQGAPATGDARRAILELLADGEVWTPSKIANARGTTPNAATRALKRMLQEPEPPIRKVGRGAKYRIAPSKGGGAQGSPSADSEGGVTRSDERGW